MTTNTTTNFNTNMERKRMQPRSKISWLIKTKMNIKAWSSTTKGSKKIRRSGRRNRRSRMITFSTCRRATTDSKRNDYIVIVKRLTHSNYSLTLHVHVSFALSSNLIIQNIRYLLNHSKMFPPLTLSFLICDLVIFFLSLPCEFMTYAPYPM